MNNQLSKNSITLFASDKNPLNASCLTLDALNESRNIREWMMNEFVNYKINDSLTQSDIEHKINMVMGCKMVPKTQVRKIEHPFGLIFDHSMTEEPIGENFTLSYLYTVDLSDASTQSFLRSSGPSVTLMQIERKIVPPEPHVCNIKISKDLYIKFMHELKAFQGATLTDINKKMVLGVPNNFMLDNPKLYCVQRDFENFIAYMEIMCEASANSIIRGDNTQSLHNIIMQSPSLYSLPKNRIYNNVTGRDGFAKKLISIVSQRVFGINKMIPGGVSERNNPADVINEVLEIFLTYTDNDGALNGLGGEIIGASFTKPDAIAITTKRIIDKLLHDKICKKFKVDLSQTMTLLSLSREDVHPWNVHAPRSAVTLKNGQYVRDADRQMMKKKHVKKDVPIIHGHIYGKNVIFINVEDEDHVFSNNIATDSQMTTTTSFDFIIPTGIHMTTSGSITMGPTRQNTTFTNEHGDDYTLSCKELSGHLLFLFSSETHNNYEPTEEEAIEDVESSLVFYSEKSGEKFKRNTYMVENYYYNNDIMAMNIINVILNRTNDVFYDFFHSTSDIPQEVKPKLDEKIIIQRVHDYFSRKSMNIDNEIITDVYKRLYNLQNADAVKYLKFVNMGFGVIWLKEQNIQSDSMLLCRPSGFAHFSGAPKQTREKDHSNESDFILYTSKAYSTTSRQSLSRYPSIMWKNASVVETINTTDDNCINTLSEADVMDSLNFLNQMKKASSETTTINRNLKGNGWWPIITPPFMCKSHFSTPHSPFGRSGIHFPTEEIHQTEFFNRNQNDIFHANQYTTNEVFKNMKNNINTIFLYDKKLFFNNEDFPFHKYMNFNPVSANAINTLIDIKTNMNNKRLNCNRSDAQGVRGIDELNLSKLIGAAIPKTCWTNAELLMREDLKQCHSYRKNSVITSESDFYINGHDFVGKWDRCTVNEDSFL